MMDRADRKALFAARLIDAQASARITNDELARRTELGLRLISRYRAKEIEPSGFNLVLLAKALRRDAAWFYEEDSDLIAA